MRILLNYKYKAGPGTTASYIERAILGRDDIEMFRYGENRLPCADIYLNIEPCEMILRYPGRKVAYWEIDNHIHRGNDFAKYGLVDYLFLAQCTWDDYYPMKNKFWVPLAADPNIHKNYEDEKIEYDIGFLGNDNYPYRRYLLEEMSKKYKVLWSTAKPREEYARKLSQCKLLFNCAMDNDVNMRFFEAISMGKLLLTDHVNGQNKLFNDGKEYVTYGDWSDLDKKIEYYLSHPIEAEKIGQAGRAHLVKEHTYDDRLQQMLDIMYKN